MRKLDAYGNETTADRTKPPYVTPAQFAALVPNPDDECYFIADATTGTIWHLRYNAASGSAYKWESVGSATPIIAEDAAGGTTTSTTYVDVGTTPSITVPRAGDYIIEFASELGVNAGNIGTVAVYSTREAVKLGAAATSDNDSFLTQLYGGGSELRSTGAKIIRRTLAASDVVKLQTKVAATASTSGTSRRSLAIRPARIS